MNRQKKLLLNSATGILKQSVAVICGFILPRFMLVFFGSEVNGLVSSVSHFLSFISLLEMGVGPVIQANLYKPLADKDFDQISRIVKSSDRFFHTIGYIFLAYIGVLSLVYPVFVNSNFDAFFTVSLIVIIAISTLAQYFFGMTYQLLLNADQKAYIQQLLSILTIIFNTIISIVLMELGASIQVVQLASAVIFVLRPLVQNLYVKNHYYINKSITLIGEPIKQKWNGFSQHLAAVVSGNIDVVLLTFISTLGNVSVYNVYYLVTNGVTQIVMTAAIGLESLFGNMIAKNEEQLLHKTFETVEWIIHVLVIAIFSVTAITICPFIKVYTYGINDVEYYVPLFGALLVFAYCAQCLRVPYFRIIKAAGHFKQTQNGAFIATGLNIVVSVIFVFKFDLIGVAIGTFVAMMFHTCYFVWYLKSNILKRPIRYFLQYIAYDAIMVCLSYLLTSQLSMSGVSYLSWVYYAVKVFGIVILITVMLNTIFFRKQTVNAIRLLKK